jgi:tetratricopeptide (TPR) repeat protein
MLIRGVLFIAGCILALVFIVQLQQYLDHRIDRSDAQIQELAQLPRGEHLKPALLGYHNLGADILWLRLLQVLGKKRTTADEYEWIYHALDVITTLDPQYDYAYYVGGVVLTNLANRVDLSNQLLEKGLKDNPNEWSIPFLLGYNHYFIQGDAAKAADYIAAAARLPGGPAYLPGLASRMYAEANNPETALQFLEALWRQTQDSGMREVLDKRAKEIIIERDIRLLESAIQQYRTEQSHLPRTLQDLVPNGHLSRIPQEPFGGVYELDPKTGNVTSSTHPDRLKVFRLDKQGPV